MGIAELVRKVEVEFFRVHEVIEIIEQDSPTIGSEQVVDQKIGYYEAFHSRSEAFLFLEAKAREYCNKNKTLKKVDGLTTSDIFRGTTNHPFSHRYEIRLIICSEHASLAELPIDIENKLANPQYILKSEQKYSGADLRERLKGND